jgi:solute carrier family 36 (proton-coupled amino acid transporter)
MFLSIGITFYYLVLDLPDISDRKLINVSPQLPLFIGTSIYLFEGIGMVLPLKNEMKEPKDFSKRYGVLNIGTISLIIMFIVFGFAGYWRYGNSVKSSLSLNLPADEWFVFHKIQ